MQKKRVLVWGLSNNRAGTEAVIRSYVKSLPERSFDFLCYERPDNHDDLFRGTDNRYFVIPIKIKHPMKNRRALHLFMEKNASLYSSLWFNVNEISNIDLLVLAKRYGIRQRITHIHNSQFPNVFITKVFSRLNWKRCLKLTTERWACSESAGKFLYKTSPFRVIPNFVDVGKIKFSAERREQIRKERELENAFVIGTVGRLAHQKNQRYLIELMPLLLAENPRSRLLLVGEGDLRRGLEDLARDLGVEREVQFLGAQIDIQGYLSAFDVFALPSHYEGLSISALEAQYNGLPCVFSEGISDETSISSGAIKVPLTDKQKWVDALLSADRGSACLLEEKARKHDSRYIHAVAVNLFA